MPTVLITGGRGLIGTALSTLLISKGYEVIVLTRATNVLLPTPPVGQTYASWDIEKQTIDLGAIAKADFIIHLAGAGVAEKRWTINRKKEIVDSRTKSSLLIATALQKNRNKVKAFIGASAIGWYGQDSQIPNPTPFLETDPPDSGFLGKTCRLWEESMDSVATFGKRLVRLRTGIVLSNKGGAMVEFKRPARFGVAAILGNGKQVLSWVHLDDLCRMYLQAMEDESMDGVFNAVAPNPVSNKVLTLQIAKALRNRFYIPVHVPSVVLKLILGELSIEVLKSTTVDCGKIRNAGFIFQYPTIDAAIHQLIKN